MHADERRRSPRIDNNIPLKISLEDFDIVTESKNLSASGAYCIVDKELAPMTKLKLQLLIPSKKKAKTTVKKVCCEGVVVRVKPLPSQERFSVAIYFSSIQEKDKKCITQYVETLLKTKPQQEWSAF
ncbi:MAG: PilZ domain-containing protein [Candidatus Aceula meridiana]|nr:PilZ domain-containing protein [Candidatus Aceula meridiana]